MMLDFEDFANKISYTHFRKIDVTAPVWIFGAGGFAQDLAQVLVSNNIKVKGFIESKVRRPVINDIPVLSWQDANVGSDQVLMGIYNQNYPYTDLLAEAAEHGITGIFMPWEIYAQFNRNLGPRYWLTRTNFINEQLDNIKIVHDMLEDDLSRQVLLKVCLFRVGLLDSYADFTTSEHHYFNPLSLSGFNRPITIIDGGAFTGDTYLDAKSRTQVQKAYLFEPDANNFKKLVKNAPFAFCIPMALSDHHQILTFSGGEGPSSSLSESGGVHVTAVGIDEMFGGEQIDFIKLDVEGAEISAINGSHKVIERCRPVLSIALYHTPDHLWQIPLTLKDICKDYKFYIRQHEFNSFECVLYAIPKQ